MCGATASAVRGSGSQCHFEWDRATQGTCSSWLSMVFMLTEMGSQMWGGGKGEIQDHKPTREGLLSPCLVYDSCQELKLPSFCGLWKTRQKLPGEQLCHFVKVINIFWDYGLKQCWVWYLCLTEWLSFHPAEPEASGNHREFTEGIQDVDCKDGGGRRTFFFSMQTTDLYTIMTETSW